MRDTLSFLHTTPQYQSAVLNLLIQEANTIARRLGIAEEVPADISDNADRSVDPPPYGVGGSVNSHNYSFSFSRGRLHSITKRDWMRRTRPPITGYHDLIGQPSLLDTTSARALAASWLTALGVDLPALERTSPPIVRQAHARHPDSRGRESGEKVPVPFFILMWGMPLASVVTMQILGTTRELIGLEIDSSVPTSRPLLELPNAAELIGSPPPPRHFVEQRLGGKEIYEMIEGPDEVIAWLLTSSRESGHPQRERSAPVTLSPSLVTPFASVFLKFDSHLWMHQRLCHPDYGARLRFHKDSKCADISICYDCDMIEVNHAGKSKSLDLMGSVHNPLVKAIQAVFPEDELIANLKLHPARK